MKKLLIVAGIFVASQSFGQDVSSVPSKDWEVTFGVGNTLFPKSDVVIKHNGDSLTSANSKDNASVMISASVGRAFNEHFSLSFQTFWSKYNYTSGSPADTQVSFLLTPKVYTNFGKSRAWFGVGIGFTNVSLGTTSATGNGVTITSDSSSILAFTYSPTIGLETNLSDSLFLGWQFSYNAGSGTLNMTARDSSGSAALNEEVSRSWFGSLLYVGSRFGSVRNYDAPVSHATTEAPIAPTAATKEDASGKLDADELMKIKKLHDAGVLTDSEYEERKTKLLK